MIKDTNSVVARCSKAWIIYLAVLCFLLFVWGHYHPSSTTGGISHLVGHNLPIALIMWAIFHANIGRYEGRTVAWCSFLAIVYALMLTDLVSHSQQKVQARQAITEIERGFSTLYQQGIDSHGAARRTVSQLDTNPTTKGEIGEAERWMKTFMNKVASQANDYSLELEALGLPKLLDPGRVSRDKTLAESRMMVKRAKEIANKYRAETSTLFENARKDISTLNIRESVKEEMLKSFDKGVVEARDRIEASWDIDAKIIIQCENIVELLSEKSGEWEVHGNRILFGSEGNVGLFNGYLTELRNLLRERQEIQKRDLNAVNNEFSRLKGLY